MENEIHRLISDWIKQLRVQRKLTLGDASCLLGWSINHLERFESGVPIPLNVIAKITTAYRISHMEVYEKIMTIQAMIRPTENPGRV